MKKFSLPILPPSQTPLDGPLDLREILHLLSGERPQDSVLATLSELRIRHLTSPLPGRLDARDLRSLSESGVESTQYLVALLEFTHWFYGQTAMDPEIASVLRIRGQVPPLERIVLALRPQSRRAPITLGVGVELTVDAPLGSYAAQLLAEPGERCWLAYLRPGTQPSPSEVVASNRLLEIGALLGLDLERVLVFGQNAYWVQTREPMDAV